MISKFFWLFYWFCVFLSHRRLIMLFSIVRIKTFFLLICLQVRINLFFFQAFHCIIIFFLRKWYSFIIAFKDKVSDFIDWHFLKLLQYLGYKLSCIGNQKSKKWILYRRRNSIKTIVTSNFKYRSLTFRAITILLAWT